MKFWLILCYRDRDMEDRERKQNRRASKSKKLGEEVDLINEEIAKIVREGKFTSFPQLNIFL